MFKESAYQRPVSFTETVCLTPEMAQGLLDFSKENEFKNIKETLFQEFEKIK